MIILDTNVVSELMRLRPDPSVLNWIKRAGDTHLATTSITIAEIEYGLARMSDGARARSLRQAADTMWATFADFILPFTAGAAVHYGPLVAKREMAGRPISGFDAQIAAIAKTFASPLATRNVADFRGTGIKLINPWIATN